MTWEARIFVERPGMLNVVCAGCARTMFIPPSKAQQKATCSNTCRAKFAANARKPCETCGEAFRPRLTQLRLGQGRFCSQACNTAARAALQTPAAQAKAADALRAAFADGRVTRESGAANKQWRGGRAAYRQRRRDSGAEAAALRDYRRRNPHKAKEFAARRYGKRIGNLPPGTIQAIGDAQRWRCAICRVSIRSGYHDAHVTPLKRGGEHAGRNIQLLCPPCNARKSARDPIDHMRSLGRLL